MIDLYYWPTPNGKKVSIMLEECDLEYNAIPVNIGRGDQFAGEFLTSVRTTGYPQSSIAIAKFLCSNPAPS